MHYKDKSASYTVYWEIFEVQNFRDLVILKFFTNKFSRMAIKARSGHVRAFKFSRLQEKFAKTYNIALDIRSQGNSYIIA